MSSDDNVNTSHTLGDLLIHVKARVTQGNYLIIAQGFQFIHLDLERLHFISKLKMGSWNMKTVEIKDTSAPQQTVGLPGIDKKGVSAVV